MGLIFKTVDHLVEALKPNLLPEYILDGLGKKKNSLNSNTQTNSFDVNSTASQNKVDNNDETLT